MRHLAEAGSDIVAQVTYSVVPKPTAPKSGWSLHRALVVASVVPLVTALLLEFGFSLDILMMGAPAIPGIVFALLLVGLDRGWVYLTAGILMSVLPIMVLFLFGAVAGLVDPTAGRSFAALMALILTLVLALAGGIGGFLAKRRGQHRPVGDALRSRLGIAAVVFTVFLVASGLTGVASGIRVKDIVSGAGGYDFAVDTTVPVTMTDFAFVPTSITVPSGEIVEIKVTNEDTAFHTFTYAVGGKTYNHDFPGGSESGFLVNFAEPGTILFWCAPHSAGADSKVGEGSEDMAGTIVVT